MHKFYKAISLGQRKGKGQSDFSDWPLFMPATTAVYPEPVEGLPHTWRVQYNLPCEFDVAGGEDHGAQLV
jgi:hypothetical protein